MNTGGKMLAFNDTYWLKHGQDFNKGYYIIHYTETSRGGKKKEKKQDYQIYKFIILITF